MVTLIRVSILCHLETLCHGLHPNETLVNNGGDDDNDCVTGLATDDTPCHFQCTLGFFGGGDVRNDK